MVRNDNFLYKNKKLFDSTKTKFVLEPPILIQFNYVYCNCYNIVYKILQSLNEFIDITFIEIGLVIPEISEFKQTPCMYTNEIKNKTNIF